MRIRNRPSTAAVQGALPERQQHLAEATALWLAGYSKREACRQTGVPRTTLSVSLDKAGLTESDRAKYTDIVEDLALRAAQEAGRQLLERLEGDDEALTPMQLATVFGIACDKIVGIRRVKTAPEPGTGLPGLLERLMSMGGGAATLTVEPARVIEAEGDREGHSGRTR